MVPSRSVTRNWQEGQAPRRLEAVDDGFELRRLGLCGAADEDGDQGDKALAHRGQVAGKRARIIAAQRRLRGLTAA
jgi:hypothetical protein